MNTKKRLTALFLAIAMAFGSISIVMAAPNVPDATFNIETGTWSDGADPADSHNTTWDGNILTVHGGANIAITGTVSGGFRRVVVADTATVGNPTIITLQDVSISIHADEISPFTLNPGANLTLLLIGDNHLENRAIDLIGSAGIRTPEGTTITIGSADCTGSLTAIGYTHGAGIGGGRGENGGNITIGGNVNVTAISSGQGVGAGIGGGGGGSGGTITIGGNAYVTATGGFFGAGIGGGDFGSGGNITIGGNATVTATGRNDGAGIGGGSGGDGGTITIGGNATVTATGGHGGAGIGGGGGFHASTPIGAGGNITIEGNATVTANISPAGANSPYNRNSIGAGVRVNDNAVGAAGTIAIAPTATVTVNGRGSVPFASIAPISDFTFVPGTADTITANITRLIANPITYQWYSNTSATNTGGTAIPGASGTFAVGGTSLSFPVPTGLSAGTHYYYLVLTIGNATGVEPIVSNAVTVTIPHTVTFDPNSGTLDVPGEATRAVNHGAEVGALPQATRDGYALAGWFDTSAATGGTQWQATTAVTADITLYARWTEATQLTHTITFNPNSGTLNDPSEATRTVNQGAAAGAFPQVTRDGYTLTGWFDTSAATGGTQWLPTTVVAADVTLYARWTPAQVTQPPDTGPTMNYAWLSTSRATFDIVNPQDITVFLQTGDFNLRNIRFNNVPLVRGRDYTIDGNRFTIRTEFLSTLQLGLRRLTFEMSGGASPVFTITVIDSTPDEAAPPVQQIPPPMPDPQPPGQVTPSVPQPPPPPGPMPFIDVIPTAWFYPFVNAVWEQRLFQGTSANTFSPQGNMTRAMFVQVLANLEGVNLSAYSTRTGTFGDTASTAWYFAAVEWAAGQGLVSGVGGGNFAPDRPITREEMAVLLGRYIASRGLEMPRGATPLFADQAEISPWAETGVRSIQAAGLITGHPDGRFAPRDTATRAEVAAIFARFLDVQGES